MNRVLYREWFPQILYNHHQSGPQGTVLWSPPLRDPFNYNQDPLIVLGIQTHRHRAADAARGGRQARRDVRDRAARTTAGGTAGFGTRRHSTTRSPSSPR